MNTEQITVTHLIQMHTFLLWWKPTKDLKIKQQFVSPQDVENFQFLTGDYPSQDHLSHFTNLLSSFLLLNKMCHSNKIEQLFKCNPVKCVHQ